MSTAAKSFLTEVGWALFLLGMTALSNTHQKLTGANNFSIFISHIVDWCLLMGKIMQRKQAISTHHHWLTSAVLKVIWTYNVPKFGIGLNCGVKLQNFKECYVV